LFRRRGDAADPSSEDGWSALPGLPERRRAGEATLCCGLNSTTSSPPSNLWRRLTGGVGSRMTIAAGAGRAAGGAGAAAAAARLASRLSACACLSRWTRSFQAESFAAALTDRIFFLTSFFFLTTG
jgi:hypothetical protein